MRKFIEIVSRCEAGIYLTVNPHKDSYMTVEEYFDSEIKKTDRDDIPVDVYDHMKSLNRIIELQFYPDTPIGFYRVYHYDFDTLFDIALEILK